LAGELLAGLILLVMVLIILLVSIIWPILIGSPWTPSSKRAIRKMLDMAEVGPEDTLFDLGSGDGRIVVEAAGRNRARAVGIEADPLRVLWSRLKIARLGLRGYARIVRGNFFHLDISKATVVTLFLMQGTNQRLKPKLQRELKPGTRVVSNTWTFEGWSPTKTDAKDRVYVYVMGVSDRSEKG
jgi:precorrin-6B methylase 2